MIEPLPVEVSALAKGLVAAGISVAIIAVVQGIGRNLNGIFTTLSNAFK